MNTVVALNDHGVSMVQNGMYLEGLRAIRASMKAVFYINQAQGGAEHFNKNIEADEHIQEALIQMKAQVSAKQSQPASTNPLSFMYDRLFSFSELQKVQDEIEMISLVMVFNVAVAAHKEMSQLDVASACYTRAFQISSKINSTSSRNEISQLIYMVCLNNLADIERENGNFGRVKIFLSKMNKDVQSLDQMKSSSAQTLRSNLQLNAMVFNNLSTAGAA